MGILDKEQVGNIRYKSKVINIPSSSTVTQIESALDDKLNNGWQLHSFQNVGSNVFAILIKEKSR